MKQNKIENYKPYKGFYDLREFVLSKRIFRKLWYIQDILNEMNTNKKYYKKWHIGQWQKAQEISANYQQILLRCKTREGKDGHK